MKDLKCETSKDEAVNAFMQVLDINGTMAEFFLDSAAWNIETAIMLYLDNMQQGQTSNQLLAQQFSAGTATFLSSSDTKRLRKENQYEAKEVYIHNLPKGWGARVSRHSGEIYFYHEESGKTQREVPPGFADLKAGDEADDSGYGDNDSDPKENYISAFSRHPATSNPFTFQPSFYVQETGLGTLPPQPPAEAETGLGLGSGAAASADGNPGTLETAGTGVGDMADLTDDNTEAAVMGDLEGNDEEMGM